MTERRIAFEDLELMDEWPAWVQNHSVTCPICGDLGDEREATRITADEMELGGAMQAENPERYNAILAIADEYGEGEAHELCVKAYMQGEDEDDEGDADADC